MIVVPHTDFCMQTRPILEGVLGLPLRLSHVASLPHRAYMAYSRGSNERISHACPERCWLWNVYHEHAHDTGIRHLHPQLTLLVLLVGKDQRALPAVHNQPVLGPAFTHSARNLTDDP